MADGRTLARRVLPPLSVLAALLASWWLVAESRAVSGLLLPHPHSVLVRLGQNIASGELLHHVAYTLAAVLSGFAVGGTVALVFAFAMTSSRVVHDLLIAHVIAFQSIPKVSIAPLVFLWLGFNMASSVVLVALVCFFPVFTHAASGLRTVDPDLVALYRAAGASRWRVTWKVALPSALPQIMTGLQVAIVFSLLAAVVMEFIMGTVGLGFLIENSANTWDTPQVFASILALACLGILLSALMRRLRRRLVFWEAGGANTAEGLH
jgi:NitT/TauT family transport system permease protein